MVPPSTAASLLGQSPRVQSRDEDGEINVAYECLDEPEKVISIITTTNNDDNSNENSMLETSEKIIDKQTSDVLASE